MALYGLKAGLMKGALGRRLTLGRLGPAKMKMPGVTPVPPTKEMTRKNESLTQILPPKEYKYGGPQA